MENPAGLAAFFLGMDPGMDPGKDGNVGVTEGPFGEAAEKREQEEAEAPDGPRKPQKTPELRPKTAPKIPSSKIPGSDGKIPAVTPRERWEAAPEATERPRNPGKPGYLEGWSCYIPGKQRPRLGRDSQGRGFHGSFLGSDFSPLKSQQDPDPGFGVSRVIQVQSNLFQIGIEAGKAGMLI